MSRHTPGSTDWWVETALIAGGGILLAIFLWDGPPPVDTAASETARGEALTAPDAAPRTAADLLDAGCLTAEHLQAMREGRRVDVFCPEPDQPTVLLRDLPPEQRPFP